MPVPVPQNAGIELGRQFRRFHFIGSCYFLHNFSFRCIFIFFLLLFLVFLISLFFLSIFPHVLSFSSFFQSNLLSCYHLVSSRYMNVCLSRRILPLIQQLLQLEFPSTWWRLLSVLPLLLPSPQRHSSLPCLSRRRWLRRRLSRRRNSSSRHSRRCHNSRSRPSRSCTSPEVVLAVHRRRDRLCLQALLT